MGYYEKKNEHHNYSIERGGYLTAFLVVQFIYNIVLILGTWTLINSEHEIIIFPAIAIFIIRLLLIAQVWHWYKTGYYGFMVINGLGIVWGLYVGFQAINARYQVYVDNAITSSFLIAIILLLEVCIFYYLMRDKRDYFF